MKTIAEAARVLGISRQRLYQMIDAGTAVAETAPHTGQLLITPAELARLKVRPGQQWHGPAQSEPEPRTGS